jgi:hypothetical protein
VPWRTSLACSEEQVDRRRPAVSKLNLCCRPALRRFNFTKRTQFFIRVSACDGFLNPNVPILRDGRYINTRGEPVTWMKPQFHGVTTSIAWDEIRIDHFQVKSRVECERKKTRGDAFDADQDYQRYFEQNDRNEVDDPKPETLVERTRQEIVRIMMEPRNSEKSTESKQ